MVNPWYLSFLRKVFHSYTVKPSHITSHSHFFVASLHFVLPYNSSQIIISVKHCKFILPTTVHLLGSAAYCVTLCYITLSLQLLVLRFATHCGPKQVLIFTHAFSLLVYLLCWFCVTCSFVYITFLHFNIFDC